MSLLLLFRPRRVTALGVEYLRFRATDRSSDILTTLRALEHTAIYRGINFMTFQRPYAFRTAERVFEFLADPILIFLAHDRSKAFI